MKKRIAFAVPLSVTLTMALIWSGCGLKPMENGSAQNFYSEQTESESNAAFSSGNTAGDTAEETSEGMMGETTGDTENEAAQEMQEEVEKDTEFSGIPFCNVGDILSFGSYEQDNDTENGSEAIQWLVVDKNGDTALLLSKYGLDAQAYNDSDEAVTWENSTLRQWLNEFFYISAFSDAERQVIIPVTNVNPDNARWGTAGGNDTEDAVFVLSIDEAEMYFSDRNENFWTQATPYAVQQGAFVADNGYSPWWLRSPGDHNDGGFCAAYVDYPPAGVVLSGYAVQRNSRVVRPALWVRTQQ